MIFFILTAVGWVGLVVQLRQPSPPWMLGGQILPVLAVLLYAAIYTHSVNGWLQALLLGVAWDCLMGNKLGCTSPCLLAIVSLVKTQPLDRLRQYVVYQIIVCVAAIALFFLMHLWLVTWVEKRNLYFSKDIVWNVAVSALINGVFCPIFFSLLHPIFLRLGHQPPREGGYHA